MEAATYRSVPFTVNDMALGPLNWYWICFGLTGYGWAAQYVYLGCDATLAQLGYNIVGKALPKYECGDGAALMLGYLVAFFVGISGTLLVVGLAPALGAGPVPKRLHLLIFLLGLVPSFAGCIASFALIEVEAGSGVFYPYLFNALFLAVATVLFGACYLCHADERSRWGSLV